jgi:hypothetical protein
VGGGRIRLSFFFLCIYIETRFKRVLTGQPAYLVPGRAACQAGVAAQARARYTGRASPGTGD